MKRVTAHYGFQHGPVGTRIIEEQRAHQVAVFPPLHGDYLGQTTPAQIEVEEG